jgi:membrane fusion protein (multidrug efflux system)
MTRKIVLWTVAAVAVLAGGAAVAWRTGALPLATGTLAAVADSARADTAAAGAAADAAEAPAEPAVPVELTVVRGRGIAAYYRAASVVEADRLVDVVARSRGRVRTVRVEEGDRVEQGDVLAELENDRERIQLHKAQLTLEDKQRQRDRSRQMLDEALISRQEFDDRESAFRLAEAERDLAAITFEETLVRAPFGGRVTERRVVPGQQVEPGAPVFTLGDFSPLRVRVHLPEAIARKVAPGQRVLVAPEAADQDCEAVVERVAPVVDPQTSTVRLTLLLQDEAALRVGGFVKVRITTDSRHDALALPKTALVEEGSLRSVFVAEADTVRKVEVRTGLYDETHVEVLEGVFEGDRVVTMGQGGLRTGTRIEVLNAAALDDPAPAAGPALARSE